MSLDQKILLGLWGLLAAELVLRIAGSTAPALWELAAQAAILAFAQALLLFRRRNQAD